MRGWRTWRVAMSAALYGPGGFYRRPGATGHFGTAAVTCPARLADAVRRLADRVDAALGRPDPFQLVDLGAGRGGLLTALAGTAPGRWRLTGVDLAGRPAGLPARVGWAPRPPTRVTGLVLAVEWLDVVPLDVAVLTRRGPRLVEVDRAGRERLGPPAPPGDRAWLTRWWPDAGPSARLEIGRSRDAAWVWLLRRLRRGAALAVDYAPARDGGDTLTGYRDGRQVRPVPDGSCDLTAHVALPACAAAGTAAGATGTRLLSQRQALRWFRTDARPGDRADPAGQLAALAAAGAAGQLGDPAGLGAQRWLIQEVR